MINTLLASAFVMFSDLGIPNDSWEETRSPDALVASISSPTQPHNGPILFNRDANGNFQLLVGGPNGASGQFDIAPMFDQCDLKANWMRIKRNFAADTLHYWFGTEPRGND